MSKNSLESNISYHKNQNEEQTDSEDNCHCNTSTFVTFCPMTRSHRAFLISFFLQLHSDVTDKNHMLKYLRNQTNSCHDFHYVLHHSWILQSDALGKQRKSLNVFQHHVQPKLENSIEKKLITVYGSCIYINFTYHINCKLLVLC